MRGNAILLLGLIIAAGLSLVRPAEAAVVFSDTFTEGVDTNVDEHTPDTGTSWFCLEVTGTAACEDVIISEANDEVLGGTVTDSGVLFRADVTGGYGSANYEVSMEQVMGGGNFGVYNVLAARIQGSGNMYAVRWNVDEGQIYKRVSGTWTALGAEFNPGVADAVTVTFIVDGDTLTFKADVTTLRTVTDSDITAVGTAGFGMGGVINSSGDLFGQTMDNFQINTLADTQTISGTVYTDEGSTNIGADKTVRIAINGTDHATTDETDSSGAYSISDLSLSAGDVITAYLEDETEDAVAATVSDGSDLSGLSLYQNRLITRHDNAGSLTNANLATAAVSGEDDISNIYSVSAGALTVADGKELLVWTGDTFAPGGAVTADDIDINGTFTMAGNAVTVSGTWDATGGAFTSSGTVTFDSGSAETIVSDGDSFNTITFDGAGTWTLEDALDADGNLTITNGTLDANTSENNAITLAGNWNNSGGTFVEREGTVTFNGSGAQTLTGETFYNLTINNSAGSPGDSTDVDSSAAVTVTNTLLVSDGQFRPASGSDFATVSIGANGILQPAAGANITVSGNWSNAGTFTANSGTVTFDGTSQTLNDDNTFYNFTKSVSAADTLTFEVSTTQTISNTLTLNGTSSAALSLRSSSTGIKFTLSPASATTVTYLDVKDSQASTSSITCTTGCTNSGNNDNGEAAPHWIFAAPNTTPTASSVRSIEHDTATGYVTFKVDMADSDGNVTQAQIEYSFDGNNWSDPTLGDVSADEGGVEVKNSETYQIQSIDTDGGDNKVTLTIIWKSQEQIFERKEDRVFLRVTPHDGTEAGSTTTSEEFSVDNTPTPATDADEPGTAAASPQATAVTPPADTPILPIIPALPTGLTFPIETEDADEVSDETEEPEEEDGVGGTTEDTEDTNGPTVIDRIAKQIGAAAQAIADIIPTQEGVTTTLAGTAAIATAASSGLVSALPNLTSQVLHFLERMASGLIGVLGVRRRRPWGKVVDGTTGAGLPQVIVRILDRQTQRIKDTAVTDAKGEFASLLPAGQYRLQAIKPGWQIDPRPETLANKLTGEHIYDGNVMSVAEEKLVAVVVALRPVVSARAGQVVRASILQKIERVLAVLSWPLLLAGLGLSVFAVAKERTMLNWIILGVYLVLISGKYWVQSRRQETSGHVRDAKTGVPLAQAFVQLFDAETGRRMASKVTTEAGQFVLLPPPGVYTLVVSHPGYEAYRESHIVVKPEQAGALSLTLELTPQAPGQLTAQLA